MIHFRTEIENNPINIGVLFPEDTEITLIHQVVTVPLEIMKNAMMVFKSTGTLGKPEIEPLEEPFEINEDDETLKFTHIVSFEDERHYLESEEIANKYIAFMQS